MTDPALRKVGGYSRRLDRQIALDNVRKDAATVAVMPLDDQTARELARAAKNVQLWTEKRNELIKSSHAAGGGVREIARATGLNVATVHNILKPRRR